ncbi:MAG: DUF1385 domain-containing protein [Actinobacteria bacterium]|nr:DUF1385 domain-containing protein [Actinomycetota bacterium]
MRTHARSPSRGNCAEGDARIGGQALIEGVMMRGRRFWSLAVRRPDGTIYSQVEPLRSFLSRHPSWDRPFLRGVFVLAESLVLGWRALSLSADLALEGEEDGEALGWWSKALSFLLAVVLAVGLFIALPTWLAPRLLPEGSPVWLWNLVEGGMRVAFFVAYLILVSLSREMRRVFQYHGAEHQSIHLLEKGYPLEPERALREGTDHLRCGTSFILLVLVLTVLVYSFLGKPALWLRVLERLAVIPLVAGTSYEIMRYAERSRSPWLSALVAPGLALQRLTTRRPEREQVEVALAALGALLEREGEGRQEVG